MIIETEYLLIALGLLLLYVIYFVMSKDTQHSRQIRAIANAVEEFNRRLYAVEKNLSERIDAVTAEHSDDELFNEREALERRVQQVAAQLSHSIMGMEEGLGAFKSDIDKRLSHLEEGMRQLSMPSSVTGMDDEKIIALYKQGVAIDAIAKELRLSKAEVEFVLKINKIR
jgi:hypothetical protein